MTEENFTSWGDLDNDKPSIWSSDWYIDIGQEKEKVFLTMTYDGRLTVEWFYNEILESYESKNVKGLLEKYFPDENILEEDISELSDFFSHWLTIIDSDGSLEFDIDEADLNEVTIDPYDE